MPDDQDYRTLEELLARPGEWSSSERGIVEFTLRQQRELLEAAHPKDVGGRKWLGTVVAQIEAALAAAGTD